MPTAPHLAELELSYATPERTDDFFAVVLRGFYDDYKPELWEAGRGVFEPERNFGFTVDDRWVSTCGAYSRRMAVPGGEVPVAAVTFVTVNPGYRRRGLLRQMMTHQLADIAARGTEPVALLWASESAIYGRFGYGPTTPRLKLSGSTRELQFLSTVDLGGGSVGEVERDTYLQIAPTLQQQLLPDRPGALARSAAWWTVALHDPEPWRDGASELRFVLHFDRSGEPDGYLAFRVKDSGVEPGAEVRVVDVDGATPAAYAALWRFVLDLDLVRSFTRSAAPLDDPLRYLVSDQRAVTTEIADGTFARLVDVRRALTARRYAADLDVVIQVEDPLLDHNNATLRLQAGPEGASVTRARRKPDLVLNVRELASIYLGGTPLSTLHRAGLVTEQRPGAVRATSAAFTWSPLPFCPDFF